MNRSYLTRFSRSRTVSLALGAAAGLCLLGSPARAQPSIDWRTIDCGGGRSSGGVYTIDATIGQHDAGPGQAGMSAGALSAVGGFWAGVSLPPPCVADFDQSGSVTVNDIFVFLNAWFIGCDGTQFGEPCLGRTADVNGINGVDVNDIFVYLNLWFAGCP